MPSLRILVVYEGAHAPADLLALLTGGSHAALAISGFDGAAGVLVNEKFDAVLLESDYEDAHVERFALKIREMDGDRPTQGRTVLLSCAPKPPEHPSIDLHLTVPDDFAELTAIVGELASFRVLSSEPPPEPSGELPVFEPDGFGEQCAQDAELMVEILDLFAAECEEELPGIANALTSGDFDRASRLAHSLKGSLGSLHAARARRHAQSLEMAAREAEADGCRRHFEALCTEISTLQDHLASFRQSCLCR